MKNLLCAAAIAGISASGAAANQIEQACVRSDRPAANRALCGCIQDAANLTLSTGDQRRAAKFFKDPQKAQDERQASDGQREDFWDRYKRFGQTAGEFCAVS